MFSALDIKTLMQGTLYGDPSLRVDPFGQSIVL